MSQPNVPEKLATSTLDPQAPQSLCGAWISGVLSRLGPPPSSGHCLPRPLAPSPLKSLVFVVSPCALLETCAETFLGCRAGREGRVSLTSELSVSPITLSDQINANRSVEVVQKEMLAAVSATTTPGK